MKRQRTGHEIGLQKQAKQKSQASTLALVLSHCLSAAVLWRRRILVT